MDLKGKKVVVTGGCGFIGSHLVAQLAVKECDVVIIDDLSTGRVENVIGFEGSINHINMSITEDIDKFMVGADMIFHLAANVSVIKSIENPQFDAEVNAKGTLNVLETARKMDIKRVVYSSSCAVYGNTKVVPTPEKSEVRPTAPYGTSKYVGELYCKLYSGLYGINTVSLRYFNVYGPRQSADSQYSGVIARFIKNAVAGKRLTIFGHGEQSRDFVSVNDVVKANFLAAGADLNGEVFNIGTGVGTTINKLGEYMEDLSGKLGVDYKDARKGEIETSCADISWAKDVLDYKPSVPLAQGLKDLYDATRVK